jgi:hypothetical protein
MELLNSFEEMGSGIGLIQMGFKDRWVTTGRITS